MLALLLSLSSTPAVACENTDCTPAQRRAWIRQLFEDASGRKVKYRVVGLDCPGCPGKLRKALLEKPGIHAVMIDGDAVHIAYEPMTIEHAGLLAAIRGAGDFRELVLGKGPIPSVQAD